MNRLLLSLLTMLAIAGCAPIQAAVSPAQPSNTSTSPTQVTIAMGYIPNIQFAPFYVAEKKGYFAAEGLKVNYDWGLEVDGVKLVGANQIDFAIVGGDQVIQARAQKIPIVYVANWYNAFPIEIVSFKERNIVKPQDLEGKKVGMPCLCGATYTAWRSLLFTQRIDPTTINVQNVGFTQVQALTQGAVDAVGVYANNEPVQLKMAGREINEIKTWQYTQLVGNGFATNEDTIQKNPELVRRFVRAILKGIADTVADPGEALDISVAALPEAGGKNLQSSQAILNASVALWNGSPLGVTKLSDWQAMTNFMRQAGLIEDDLDATKAFTNNFVK